MATGIGKNKEYKKKVVAKDVGIMDFELPYLDYRMADWNKIFSSRIVRPRATTLLDFKGNLNFSSANRATLTFFIDNYQFNMGNMANCHEFNYCRYSWVKNSL